MIELYQFEEKSTGRVLFINPNHVVCITPWLNNKNHTEIHTISGREYIVSEKPSVVKNLLINFKKNDYELL